jgi:uncharacterized protein YutD
MPPAPRADWQARLKQCRNAWGFCHLRFHGLFDDNTKTVIQKDDERISSFHNADQIYS